MAPRKIAILGGGPAALSAAFHLTSQADWRSRYEIIVYQLGWRLGGKCATGRLEREHFRIREHGIHLAGNFYRNLFAMTQAAYEELAHSGEMAPGETIRTLNDALIPSNYSLLLENLDSAHERFDIHTPYDAAHAVKPWESDWKPDLGFLAVQAVDMLLSILHGQRPPKLDADDRHSIFDWRLFLEKTVDSPLMKGVEHLLFKLVELAEHAMDDHTVVGRILELIDGILLKVWDALAPTRSPQGEWAFIQFDYYATVFRGMVRDEVFDHGVARLDHLSYRTWLRMHGASEQTLASPIVDLPCNICFQYENGDATHGANMSAAGYVMFMARMIMTKGEPFWYFRAGTADSIIAPIYRVLRARGVQFAFFHKVTSLELSADGSELAAIACDVQAQPKAGPLAYDPLMRLEFGDDQRVLQCWPGEPLFDQLEDGAALQTFLNHRDDAGPGLDPTHDLESYWCPQPPGAQTKTLRLGSDFDHVVFGLSIGAVPVVAPALVETHAARWKPAIHHGQAIPTQQLQVWLKASLADLGWDAARTGGGSNRLVGATLPEPLTDFCDFTDLVDWECWPEGARPGALLYFCGPMAEPHDLAPFSDPSYPDRLYRCVGKQTGSELSTAMRLLFPTAGGAGGAGFPPELLAPPEPPPAGTAPIWCQYLRQNIDPTERYVVSLPGSLAHRLEAWGSGVGNVTLTGDWIDNGLNVGCFEAAIMSGMLASFTLTGSPALADIEAYNFLNPGNTHPGVSHPFPRPSATDG